MTYRCTFLKRLYFVLGKIIWILICVMYGEKMTCVITEQLYNYESFASFWIISTLMRNADELACMKNKGRESCAKTVSDIWKCVHVVSSRTRGLEWADTLLCQVEKLTKAKSVLWKNESGKLLFTPLPSIRWACLFSVSDIAQTGPECRDTRKENLE